jgi:DNA-binding transcriptional ArsR family regulator
LSASNWHGCGFEGLVSARREGQAIFYSLLDPKVTAIIELLAQLYDVVEHD